MIDKAQKTKILMENFNNYLKEYEQSGAHDISNSEESDDVFYINREHEIEQTIKDNYPEVGDNYYVDYDNPHANPQYQGLVTVYEGNEDNKGQYLCKIYIKKMEI